MSDSIEKVIKYFDDKHKFHWEMYAFLDTSRLSDNRRAEFLDKTRIITRKLHRQCNWLISNKFRSWIFVKYKKL